MGFMIQFMFGLELGMALMISTIFSAIYVWNGGFGAVVRTDIFQFVLMFSGFILLLVFLWFKVQSPVSLINEIPENYLDPWAEIRSNMFWHGFFLPHGHLLIQDSFNDALQQKHQKPRERVF